MLQKIILKSWPTYLLFSIGILAQLKNNIKEKLFFGRKMSSLNSYVFCFDFSLVTGGQFQSTQAQIPNFQSGFLEYRPCAKNEAMTQHHYQDRHTDPESKACSSDLLASPHSSLLPKSHFLVSNESILPVTSQFLWNVLFNVLFRVFQTLKDTIMGDFPGDLVVKILCFKCKRCRFSSWLGTKTPRAAWNGQKCKKYFFKKI